MSKSTKRKHVTQEVLNSDFRLPSDAERIVKVIAGRGNNLHEVSDPKEIGEKSNYLVSMPTKFRKNVWIKRGDFVMVQPIDEGDKVKAEIVHILMDKHHIKYIKQQGLWPFPDNEASSSCNATLTNEGDSSPSHASDNDSDADDLFVNTNRPPAEESGSDSSSSNDDV